MNTTKANTIYVFDAGSTKTDVISANVDGSNITKVTISGYNPNRTDTNFLDDIKKLDIPKNAIIYFYGSGVNSIKSKQIIAQLLDSNINHINSDLLGAAKATLGKSKGIVAIMGTGGIVAYYNSVNIDERHGGYGYLIDDYGGALELGKTIVSNWLNNNYSKTVSQHLENYFNNTQKAFISNFYNQKNLHTIAGVCSIIIPLSKKCSVLNNSITNYFDTFFTRHVKPLCDKKNIYTLNTVGSIAYYFFDWIELSAKKNNIKLDKVIHKPINELLKHHLKHVNHLHL